MGSWAPPVHQFISMTPPVNVIPGWIINRTIAHFIDSNLCPEEPVRKIECYDFDPYCFAPDIDGVHGHLAYGKRGLPKLKSVLTRSRDNHELSRTLNTLCDLLHDPEKAAEAMRLNLIFQLRRLLEHDSWYLRQRSAYALKIISGQQTGRLRVVNDERLMGRIVSCMKDPQPAVRRTIYDLIHRLTTYYFDSTRDIILRLLEFSAVPKLLEYGFIKLIMETLKENFLDSPKTPKIEHTSSHLVVEPLNKDEGSTEAVDESSKSQVSASFSKAVMRDEYNGVHMEGSVQEVDDDAEIEGEGSAEDVAEEQSQSTEEYPVDDKNICVLATLMDALVNLMSFNKEATLDAICYDVLKLKRFFPHPSQTIRMLTWNVFKQIFTTDVGQMSMVPHNILDDMMRAFSNDLSPKELEEVTGTLMLALIKVENRAAAVKWGILDKVLGLAKQPNLAPSKRLAALNVLSHLAELPDVRPILRDHLFDVAIAIRMDAPELERHVETHIERVLWKP